MTANVTLTNYLLLKRANTSVSSTYTGLIGEITIDTDLDTVRVHDGTTAGGHILANVTQINDSGNLSPVNANVAAANVQIDSLRANITAANVEITSLKANAAAQQIQIDNFAANTGFATLDQLTANINTVNANVGAFQVFSNANAGTQATSINNLNANIGAYQTFANANVSVIQANLGAYQTYANTNSGSLQANLGAYQTYANANAAIQANELNNLSANAGVQATSFNLVNANVTAANSAITTLTANAATQAGLITTVNANVTAANAAIASLQSNAAVQQGVLDVLSGNAVTQTLELQQLTSNAAVQAANLTVLIANAASQQESLTVLVSNAAAQSTAIDSINANLGAYQTYANANAATQATTITTLLSNAVAQAQSLDSLNTNAATQGASIINIDANLGTATTNITALQANAGAQGAAIESINANVGAYQTFANANAAAQAGSLTTLIANAATQAQSLDSLTSNAATQAASINTIDANLGVATTNITALQSNAGSQAAAINNINANVGAYQIYANANAAAQAVSITSLTANAAAQQLQIDSFVTNTGFALVTQLTANVDTINANIGAYQTFANANAAGQTTEINSLRANITAANTLIPNLSAVSGNILPNANVTYSLGSETRQWRDLWVSNNTIYIGNTPVRVDGGTLLVNGAPVGGSYNNANVAAYLPSYTGNITAGNISTTGNISTGIITLTNGAVIKDTAFDAIAFGQGAGQISQDTYAVAIGTQAGYTTQNVAAVAVGPSAGQTNQGPSAVAIGSGAGVTDQSGLAVAIGQLAGSTTQGVAAVAIGSGAGRTSQGNYSIILNATGANLNATTANTFTVAPVRNDVANVAQVMFYNTTSKEITYGNTISVAGNITAGNISTTGNISTRVITLTNGAVIKDNSGFGVAFGEYAGTIAQGAYAVAILGGYDTQGADAIAIGQAAGSQQQGTRAVAIGRTAGQNNQGDYAISIGWSAGTNNQPARTIILNGSGSAVNGIAAQTDSFYVAPVRNDVANVAQVMFYNTTSKEITYGNTISVAGNINAAQYNFANGVSILAGIASAYGNTQVASYLPTYTGNIAGNIVKNGYTWTFSNTGTTTLPGNLVIAGNTSVFGTNGALIQPANDLPLLALSSGANGAVSSIWVEDIGNIGTSNIAAVYANPTVGSKIVRIAVGQNGGPYGPNLWDFGNTGTTRFPNGTILAPAGQNITMQSDQYSQLYWQNANVTVAPDMAINSNFYVAQNSATLDIVYRDGSSNQQQKSWLWSVDGGMSFPDSTTQYTAFSNAAVATYLANYDGGINFTASPAVITGLGNISSANFTFANGVNILSTVGANSYGNTQVATYLSNYNGDINFTSSTAIISNVDVITVGAHIQSPAYQFSNGTSIFDGITGGGGTTYTNANVIAMLAANSAVFVGNTNNVNTYSLQSNITQVFIGGNTTIASGNANVTNSTSLLHNMYFAANGTRLVRNTGAGVGLLSFDPTGFTVSGLVTVQTANSAPALPHWIKANVNGLFAPSGFTTSTITASGTVAVNATTGIQTSQTTFPLVNQTATTILFGGAATTINMGSGTIGGSGSNVFVGNAIGTSSGNLTVRAFGTYNSVNSLNSSGGYGNTTYSNIAVTGGSGTGMIISMNGAASGYLSSATVTNPGTGYQNGETITIPAGNPVGSLGGSFVIGNYNAAYLGQVLADYSFGIDGNLTLPGNVTIASVGSIRYANGVNYASTVTGTYSNTNVASYLTTATIATTGNITAGNINVNGTGSALSLVTVYGGASANASLGMYNSITDVGAQIYLGDSNFNTSARWNSAPGIGATYDSNYGGLAGALGLYTYTGNDNSRTLRVTVTAAQGQVQVHSTADSYGTNTGALTVAGGVGIGGNLNVSGNIVQQSAYYETYSNVTNSGGNLTCNFVNGATFYATLTANVTVNFTNVVATAGRVTGATLIVDQGATPYSVANLQINGGSVQSVRWAGGVGINVGTASNTDIMSFSLISLDGTNWRVLGQISNYG